MGATARQSTCTSSQASAATSFTPLGLSTLNGSRQHAQAEHSAWHTHESVACTKCTGRSGPPFQRGRARAIWLETLRRWPNAACDDYDVEPYTVDEPQQRFVAAQRAQRRTLGLRPGLGLRQALGLQWVTWIGHVSPDDEAQPTRPRYEPDVSLRPKVRRSLPQAGALAAGFRHD
jgi:hypothetical protein